MPVLINKAQTINGVTVPAGFAIFGLDVDTEAKLKAGGAGTTVNLAVLGDTDATAVKGLVSGAWVASGRKGTLRQAKGRQTINFSNGLADINSGFSAGVYSVESTLKKFSANPIRLAAAAAGGTSRITVDLSSSQTSNLQRFLADYPDMVTGLLVYVSEPTAVSGVGMYLTNQANRIAARWYLTGTLNTGALPRPGWYYMPIMVDRYGNLDTSGVVQAGLQVETTGGANNLLGSTTNYVDSVRLEWSTQAADAAGGGYVVIDSLINQPRAVAACPLVLDDGYISQYADACEYAARRGIIGSIAVTKVLVGTNGYMSVAQLQELYDQGWDLVNHATNHINANNNGTTYSTLTTIAAAQAMGGAGNLTLNGTIGSAAFDAPRCLTFNTSANDAGRSVTVTGLDEYGTPRVETVHLKNAGYFATESVWRQVTQVAVAAATTGNVSVGTSMSYAELYAEFGGCQSWLASNGWTRGSNIAVYPNGQSNTLSDRVMAALGITLARTLNVPMRYAYPFMPGEQQLQSPAFGGGGTAYTSGQGFGVVARYNAGNGTISAVTASGVPPWLDWVATMTSATTFAVTDRRTGALIGTGSTGTAFTYTAATGFASSQWSITFTITAGGTAFSAGDAFRVAYGSLVDVMVQECIRRQAVGGVYFHDIIRTGTPSSVQTLYTEYQRTIDMMAAEQGAGRLWCPTMSQLQAAIAAVAVA